MDGRAKVLALVHFDTISTLIRRCSSIELAIAAGVAVTPPSLRGLHAPRRSPDRPTDHPHNQQTNPSCPAKFPLLIRSDLAFCFGRSVST